MQFISQRKYRGNNIGDIIEHDPSLKTDIRDFYINNFDAKYKSEENEYFDRYLSSKYKLKGAKQMHFEEVRVLKY